MLLHEVGAIDDLWYARLNQLRKIWNRAAHDPFFEVNEKDLTVYDLPKEVLELEEGRPRFPSSAGGTNERFFASVSFLLGDFWNMNNKSFSAVFGEQTVAAKPTAKTQARKAKIENSRNPS